MLRHGYGLLSLVRSSLALLDTPDARPHAERRASSAEPPAGVVSCMLSVHSLQCMRIRTARDSGGGGGGGGGAACTNPYARRRCDARRTRESGGRRGWNHELAGALPEIQYTRANKCTAARRRHLSRRRSHRSSSRSRSSSSSSSRRDGLMSHSASNGVRTTLAARAHVH